MFFQICRIRKTRRSTGSEAASLLYDRRQGGQNFGAPGALHGGGQEPGRRGEMIIYKDMKFR